jgi:hypothetical protein
LGLRIALLWPLLKQSEQQRHELPVQIAAHLVRLVDGFEREPIPERVKYQGEIRRRQGKDDPGVALVLFEVTLNRKAYGVLAHAAGRGQ